MVYARRLAALGIIPVFIVLALLYNFTVPLFEGADEAAHFMHINYWAKHWRLPDLRHLSEPSHEGSQPPLYYLAGALLTSWVDRSDFTQVYQPNIDPDLLLLNGMVTNPAPADKTFPPSGAALAVRIVRTFSTLLGGITILMVYLTATRLWSHTNRMGKTIALLASALLAFNPKFIHMSSTVSNDIAVASASAVALWLSVCIATNSGRSPYGLSLACGAAVGVATLCKYNGLASAIPALAAIIGSALYNNATPGKRTHHAIAHGATFVAGFAVTCGWLFIHNTAQYGHPLAWAQVQQANAWLQRTAPLTGDQMMDRIPYLLRSYWGNFGYGIQFPALVDAVYSIALAGSVVGFILTYTRGRIPARTVLLLLSIAASILAFATWMRDFNGTENSRLLSPIFAPLSILAATGLIGWLPQRPAALGATALGLSALVFATATPLTIFAHGYAQPTYLSAEQIARLPTSGRVQFDNGIELLHATLSTNRISSNADVRISLYWRANQPMSQNYHLVVDARDDENRMIDQINGLPFGGRLPTTRWAAGGVFQDDYTLHISATEQTLVRIFVGWVEHRAPQAPAHVRGSAAVSAQIGLLKVRGTPPPEKKPGITFSSSFGEVAQLEGYQLSGNRLTLYWRSKGQPARDYTVFIHGHDAQGTQVAQLDKPFSYPATVWDRGEQIVEVYDVPNLSAARSIRLGLYDPVTLLRVLALNAQGIAWKDDIVVLK